MGKEQDEEGGKGRIEQVPRYVTSVSVSVSTLAYSSSSSNN